MKKRIRVVQYGVGPIGASIVRLLREKSALELAGAIDNDPAKSGRDLGEVVGAPDAPWGIAISSDAQAALATPVDLVIHSTSSSLPRVSAQLFECINEGACVLSTCEELAYPFRKYPELSAELDAAAKQEGVALAGTGVNPGFIMDKLLLTLSAVAQRIDAAKASRIVDAGRRREPLQRKIGAGLTLDQFQEQLAAGSVKHHGLPESVAMVADGLGFTLDDITESIEPVIAQGPLRTEFLEVAPGQVAGVRQRAKGLCGGLAKIEMELQICVGAENPEDRLELSGQPDIRLSIPGGTHGDIATAAVVVNSIPALLAAPAGLRTSRDLPLAFFSPSASP